MRQTSLSVLLQLSFLLLWIPDSSVLRPAVDDGSALLIQLKRDVVWLKSGYTVDFVCLVLWKENDNAIFRIVATGLH